MSAIHSLEGVSNLSRASFAKRYGYTIVTLGLFLVALVGHWWLAWGAYVDEQTAHGQPVEFGAYFVETGRDTLENWQSEFLQLVWQIAGLAFLLHVGSPQSREGDERIEAKLDAILRSVDSENADRLIRELDHRYDRT